MKQQIADAKKKLKGSNQSRREARVRNSIATHDPAESVYNSSARQRLVRDVKRTIELGLQASNWGDKKFKKSKIVVRQEQLRGRSGLKWVPDLVVLDEIKKEIYSVIYCIDTSSRVSDIGVLDVAFACFMDLNHFRSLPIVVFKSDRPSSRDQGFRFRFLEKCESRFSDFSDSTGIQVHILESKPKGNTELVRLVLYAIKETNQQRTGVKSIKQTLDTLAQEHPDLFAKRAEPKTTTNCAELLKQIQKQDPSLSIGQILCEAILPHRGRGIAELEMGTFLNHANDAALEKMLKRYLDLQK